MAQALRNQDRAQEYPITLSLLAGFFKQGPALTDEARAGAFDSKSLTDEARARGFRLEIAHGRSTGQQLSISFAQASFLEQIYKTWVVPHAIPNRVRSYKEQRDVTLFVTLPQVFD